MPQLNRSIPPTLPERLSYSTEPGAGLSRDPGLWEWWIARRGPQEAGYGNATSLSPRHPSGGGRMPLNTPFKRHVRNSDIFHGDRKVPDNRSTPQRQALRTSDVTSHLVQQTPAGPSGARAPSVAPSGHGKYSFEKRVEVQEVAQQEKAAAASGVVIPRLIGIPKDDELKPWELPPSFETRLRREVDEPPTYYPMPTSGRRAHSDIVRGLVHNDIVAANDETRLRGEYTPRAGGGVAVAMAGNADGAVAPPLPNPKRRNEMWLVGNNKDLKHVYKPHLDGHTQYGLEGHGYGEGLTSLTGIPVEEKSPRLRGMAADRRVQAFEHRHNDTDVTNPWGKKEWEFCEPRAPAPACSRRATPACGGAAAPTCAPTTLKRTSAARRRRPRRDCAPSRASSSATRTRTRCARPTSSTRFTAARAPSAAASRRWASAFSFRPPCTQSCHTHTTPATYRTSHSPKASRNSSAVASPPSGSTSSALNLWRPPRCSGVAGATPCAACSRSSR